MNDVISIYKRFTQYPMLKIGELSKDILSQLQAEAVEFVNSESSQPLSANSVFNPSLQVTGIFDYSGRNDISKYHTWELPRYFKDFSVREQCKPTTANLPQIKKFIEEYFQHPGRIRLSVLPSGGITKWHSHYTPETAFNTELPIHIPLVTDRAVMAQSGDFELHNNKKRYSDRNIRVPESYVEVNMKAGDIWVINPLHLHQFTNPSSIDRIHIWATTYLLDERSMPVNHDLISRIVIAMNNYDGQLFSDF